VLASDLYSNFSGITNTTDPGYMISFAPGSLGSVVFGTGPSDFEFAVVGPLHLVLRVCPIDLGDAPSQRSAIGPSSHSRGRNGMKSDMASISIFSLISTAPPALPRDQCPVGVSRLREDRECGWKGDQISLSPILILIASRFVLDSKLCRRGASPIFQTCRGR
jgi:hypothetical protein